MRFNIKDYEKAFPRKADPVRVVVQPEEKVDSVIEGSSEDPDTKQPNREPETDVKIYRGPETPEAEPVEGGDLEVGNE